MKIYGRSLRLVTLSLTLVSGLAIAQSTAPQAMTDEEQVTLSNMEINMAIQKNPDLKGLAQMEVNKDVEISALSKLSMLLTSPTSSGNVSEGYRASGIDHTTAQDFRLTSWNVAY